MKLKLDESKSIPVRVLNEDSRMKAMVAKTAAVKLSNGDEATLGQLLMSGPYYDNMSTPYSMSVKFPSGDTGYIVDGQESTNTKVLLRALDPDSADEVKRLSDDDPTFDPNRDLLVLTTKGRSSLTADAAVAQKANED